MTLIDLKVLQANWEKDRFFALLDSPNRGIYLAVVQRRDFRLFIYRGIQFAVVQRRGFSLFYIQRHLPRRCTTARFQSLLYTEAFTSPLYNSEISVSFIYRDIYLAVVQQRDFSLFYIQRHLPRRCTTARFQSLLYTEAFTSPLYNGEISVSLYTEAFTPPLYNGEISVSFIYRGIYLAVVQRRDFDV